MNPIKKARQKIGLSRNELSKVAGVGYSTIASLEKGRQNSINENVLQALEQLGQEPDRLKAEYKQYRENEREEILQKAN